MLIFSPQNTQTMTKRIESKIVMPCQFWLWTNKEPFCTYFARPHNLCRWLWQQTHGHGLGADWKVRLCRLGQHRENAKSEIYTIVLCVDIVCHTHTVGFRYFAIRLWIMAANIAPKRGHLSDVMRMTRKTQLATQQRHRRIGIRGLRSGLCSAPSTRIPTFVVLTAKCDESETNIAWCPNLNTNGHSWEYKYFDAA